MECGAYSSGAPFCGFINLKNRVNGVSRRGIADKSRVDLAHFIEASEILLLEIKRAFGLFYCHAPKGMGVDQARAGLNSTLLLRNAQF